MTSGTSVTKIDRFLGGVYGLAVGDAVGTTNEFIPFEAAQRNNVQDMIGGGKFRLLPGQWTDDTSTALCLCESLLLNNGHFDPVDQQKLYLKWYRDGHLSSTGTCFDIGKQTLKCLLQNETNKSDYASTDVNSKMAGNGSLMRLVCVPLLYSHNAHEAITKSGDSSRTTHSTHLAIDACRYFAALIIGALQGESKEKLLSGLYEPVGGYWDKYPLSQEVLDVVIGNPTNFKTKQPPGEICGSGYVIHSLEAVLWAFYHSTNFTDGLLKLVNIGDDADTTGAIYGQLAGVYYGISSIPSDWISKIELSPLIKSFAVELYHFHQHIETHCPSDIPFHDRILDDGKYKSTSSEAILTQNPISVSPTFKIIHSIYLLLETEYSGNILRRVNPCPKEYKSMEEFDQHIKVMKQNYLELYEELIGKEEGNCIDLKQLEESRDQLWFYFERRLEKTNRPFLVGKFQKTQIRLPFGGGANPFANLKKNKQ